MSDEDGAVAPLDAGASAPASTAGLADSPDLAACVWPLARRDELTSRLAGTFLRGADGRRPVFGGAETVQRDPHWRDLVLFHEYFHGDSGAGIGASHQTGWTALVAKLLQQSGEAHDEAKPDAADWIAAAD